MARVSRKRVRVKPTRKNRKQFARTANRTHRKNLFVSVARGGYRL